MADNIRRFSQYTDGSAARVLELPEREERHYPEREKTYTPDVRRNTRKKHKYSKRKKVSLLSLTLTMASISLILYMCISYIMLYSDIIMAEKEIASLESHISEMKANNTDAYDSINSSVDLREVYKIATKRLGMVHADSDQVFSYDDKRSDRIIQYSDIPK